MFQCSVLKVQLYHSIILDSSMVEHTAVNRVVVGSSPTRGVKCAAGAVQNAKGIALGKVRRHSCLRVFCWND